MYMYKNFFPWQIRGGNREIYLTKMDLKIGKYKIF